MVEWRVAKKVDVMVASKVLTLVALLAEWMDASMAKMKVVLTGAKLAEKKAAKKDDGKEAKRAVKTAVKMEVRTVDK